jgi:SAM-dependent methyltransferase
MPVRWEQRLPFLSDRTESIGFEPHYLYHPAWAARCLARLRPERHVDISSSVYFVATVSAFVPIDYYEYRPTPLGLDNLESHAADLTRLPFADNSIDSLSCMHTVEHVGLGRYGDRLDVDGDRKAAAELARVLAPGGSLLFVVPVGRPHVRFNANRVYSLAAVKALFPGLVLKESLLITDDARLIPDASEQDTASQTEGCGCYWFVKEASGKPSGRETAAAGSSGGAD